MLGFNTTLTTGSPVMDAQADFRRARRAHLAGRIGRWLLRRSRCSDLPALGDSTAIGGGTRELRVVPVEAIVGTLEPTPLFDWRFRPASEVVRHRWERIALAYRRGEALPPVVLRARPDGYYVVDGRHRVSVARALGLRDIDGWVTGARITPQARGHRGDARDESERPARLGRAPTARADGVGQLDALVAPTAPTRARTPAWRDRA
jgi:hypothetical protein